MREKWQKVSVKFYERYKVDKSFQTIIHETISVYESHQNNPETGAPKTEKKKVVIDSSPSEGPQIEQAFLLEPTLFSQNTQQVMHETASVDPLMSSIVIKSEPDLNFSSYENSVCIIEQPPDEPIIIKDSFRIEDIEESVWIDFFE